MPGGEDLSFCEKLNGAGNVQIKEYVEAGGTYIGFCAGAYYGSHLVEFNKDIIDGGEIIAERELSFFPGSATGPVLAGYDPLSRLSSRIADIKWLGGDQLSDRHFNVYYNGGCYFKDAVQYSNVLVMANYTNPGFESHAAIVRCQFGQGKALLSGVQPECSIQNLKEEIERTDDWDYVLGSIYTCTF